MLNNHSSVVETSETEVASANGATAKKAQGLETHADLAVIVAACQAEFKLEPSNNDARRRLAIALINAGRLNEAVGLLRAELISGAAGVAWMTEVIVAAMQADTLHTAGELATIFADIQFSGRLNSPPLHGIGSTRDINSMLDRPILSVDKLRHDIEQLQYLRRQRVLGNEIDNIINCYEDIIKRLTPLGREARAPLSLEDEGRIGHVYNRIVHVRDTPRVPEALSTLWNREHAENHYLNDPAGVVVIDNFLTPDALNSLQRFCLESTVWSGNRYPHGRLGAFFLSGFNCPLLLQIAEEVRTSFPQIIGDNHKLRQLWGFKYPSHLPPDSTIHADFAAVNVNFWITPNQSNLDESTGGLVIYNLDAPAEWDFASYNERLDMIKEFLRRNCAQVIRIPYRQNRAVIFNSDLFHATAEVNFRPSYEDRRINITMLYGMRERDNRHPSISARAVAQQCAQTGVLPMWRSAALLKARRSDY